MSTSNTDCIGGITTMFRHGRLTQEWILSSYLQIEKHNLDHLRLNQDKLKAANYKEVQSALKANQLGIVRATRYSTFQLQRQSEG